MCKGVGVAMAHYFTDHIECRVTIDGRTHNGVLSKIDTCHIENGL